MLILLVPLLLDISSGQSILEFNLTKNTHSQNTTTLINEAALTQCKNNDNLINLNLASLITLYKVLK